MINKEQIFHFMKFSGASIVSTIFGNVLFYFLTPLLCKIMEQPVADGLSTAICYILATILCYFLNKYLVFKSDKKSLKEAVKFFAVATPKMIITTFMVPVIIALLQTDLNIIKTLVNIGVQTVLFSAGYVFQKLWVFKEKNQAPETEA